MAEQSSYWLDIAAEDIVKSYPEGEIVVSSGISPSASYHIGHFREIMTAEALAWAVRQRGRKARHLHVVDNFDPLRKWYDFLPPAEQDYSGWPVSLVPDPYGSCHASYADHFYAEFEKSLKPMGIEPEIIKSYEDLYQPGHMVKYIEQSLEKVDVIKKIFKQKANRDLPTDWTPVLLIGDDKRFVKADLSAWDKQAKTLNGLSYEDGNAKLDWRLDWPARWAYLGVNVEPFGRQEHGASGGSYDTGKVFAKEVFGVDAPYAEVQYGHIHLPGQSIKMSSSKGNVITPEQALKIMPAEVLRYFIVRSRPENKIFFDPGIGLYNLIEEFAAAQSDPKHEFRDAYNFAVSGKTKKVISSVSFKHLVQVYQAAQQDPEQTFAVLERTGYAEQVKSEHEQILAELPYVKNWLQHYAPDEIKFAVQNTLPQVSLTDGQRSFLKIVATTIDDSKAELDGEAMHKIIYTAAEQADIPANEGFQALYRVILGKDYGPKAGWFLASLDKDWLTKRLQVEA